MTSLHSPMCFSCIHQHLDRTTCDAFPRGIPKGILLSRIDHRQAHPGDQGIRFEQDPKRELIDPDSLLVPREGRRALSTFHP